jgi:hypothetical protein
MRALAGVAAGVVAGLVIPVGFGQYPSIGVAFGLAVVFYFISLGIAKGILTFMIIIYTALHQSILT